MQKTIYF